MAKAKATSSSNNTDSSVQVLKEATCPTSSLKSTLTYQVGKDESNAIFLKISGNDGEASGPLNGLPLRISSQPSKPGRRTRALLQWLSGKYFVANRQTHPGFSWQCSVTLDSWNRWVTGRGFTRPAIRQPFWPAWKKYSRKPVRSQLLRRRPRPRQSRRQWRKRRQNHPARPLPKLPEGQL